MPSDLFSQRYTGTDPNQYGQHIAAAFRELHALTGQPVGALLSTDGSSLLAAFRVPVSLPARGTAGGVDIRAEEPILLAFDPHLYPYRAPRVWSDRADFPASRLPHLNAVKEGEPASLCLYRGDIDGWFAERGLKELLARTRRWFRDAAAGHLMPQGDRFEPARVTELADGVCFIDPDSVRDVVWRAWRETGRAAGYGVLVAQFLERGVLVAQFLEREGRVAGARVQDALTPAGAAHAEASGSERAGVIVWPAQGAICGEYFGRLPAGYDQLVQLAERVGAPLEAALGEFMKQGHQQTAEVLVTLVIPRPRQLLYDNSALELLSFLIRSRRQPSGSGFSYVGFTGGARVLVNYSLLTPRKAAELSAAGTYQADGPVVLIGCGALGSKLGLHLARAGWQRFVLIDRDTLSSHNMVRHALLGNNIWHNKAQALAVAIRSLYQGNESALDVSVHRDTAVELLLGRGVEAFRETSLILDASASQAVSHALVDAAVGSHPIVAQCELADEGRFGFLLMEGPERNPRLDDLRALLYSRALSDGALSGWLERARERRAEEPDVDFGEIAIGAGCASDTMALADDTISLHASAFSRLVRDRLTRSTRPPYGLVVVSQVPADPAETPALAMHQFDPMRVAAAANDPHWQVRISRHAYRQMLERAAEARPRETGGLLVGIFHQRRKVIYVTDLLPPPPDSVGRPYSFIRGVFRVPRRIRAVQLATGGMLTYVGEWHSHTTASAALSNCDVRAVRQLYHHLNGVRLPVHLIIATPSFVRPYVYEPGSDP